jgi:hypothetical protein
MKALLSMLLSLTVFFTSMPSAHALVGIAISNRTVRSTGGMMTAAGAGVVATSITINAIIGNSYALLALSLLGATAGIIGIVVLDEKSAELKFSALEPEKAKIIGVSQDDLFVFNSEVEELNLIKNEIESKITKKTTDKEIAQEWIARKEYLSPQTLIVASKIISTAVEVKK